MSFWTNSRKSTSSYMSSLTTFIWLLSESRCLLALRLIEVAEDFERQDPELRQERYIVVQLLSKEMVRSDRDMGRTRVMKAKRRVLRVWRSRRRRKRGSEMYSRLLKRRYARTYMIGMCDSPASLVIYRVHRPFIPARSDDEAALSSRIVTPNILDLSLANLRSRGRHGGKCITRYGPM